jgi:hypothetical protein
MREEMHEATGTTALFGASLIFSFLHKASFADAHRQTAGVSLND